MYRLYLSIRIIFSDSTWTDLTIPLHCTNAPKEVSSCFGSLIVTLDCADVDFIDSRYVNTPPICHKYEYIMYRCFCNTIFFPLQVR